MRSSEITHDTATTSWLMYWVARAWFWMWGWTVHGEVPPVRQAVLIAAPHTSNWDLPHMLATSFIFRVRLSWMGKHTLFKPPLGWLLRFFHGVPVDRRAPGGLVKQVAAMFGDREGLVMAVPPSGTRGRRELWKSGFYWIADTAQVHVVCAYLDYSRKQAGLGLAFVPSGDVASDMEQVRAFYADKQGKFPDLESTVRLKEELPDAVAST